MKPQRIIDFHVHPRYDFHLANHGVKITDELFRDDLLSCGIRAACIGSVDGVLVGQAGSQACRCAKQQYEQFRQFHTFFHNGFPPFFSWQRRFMTT
jgi:hypothetical protein